MLVVGVVLVRNEDVFVEQAIRNIAAFCDRIYAVDHLSTDLTPEILRRLASELDHLTTARSPSSPPTSSDVFRPAEVSPRPSAVPLAAERVRGRPTARSCFTAGPATLACRVSALVAASRNY